MRVLSIVLCLAPLALAQQSCMIAPSAPVPYHGSASQSGAAAAFSQGGSGGLGTSSGAISGIPSGVNEQQLYQAVLPYDQFSAGYGDTSGGPGKVERIDNPPQDMPPQEETRPGQDETKDHQLPDEQRQGQVSNTKEIHSFTLQKKTVNVNNRILHRYLKNLLVNLVYNTNIQKVNHKKLINLILTTLQETHQPKLLVKYSRQDKTNELGERSEQPEVSEDKQERQLPPVFEPATAEKIGYDGLSLGTAVGAGGNTGGGGFSTGGASSTSGGGFSSGGGAFAAGGSGSAGGGSQLSASGGSTGGSGSFANMGGSFANMGGSSQGAFSGGSSAAGGSGQFSTGAGSSAGSGGFASMSGSSQGGAGFSAGGASQSGYGSGANSMQQTSGGFQSQGGSSSGSHGSSSASSGSTGNFGSRIAGPSSSQQYGVSGGSAGSGSHGSSQYSGSQSGAHGSQY